MRCCLLKLLQCVIRGNKETFRKSVNTFRQYLEITAATAVMYSTGASQHCTRLEGCGPKQFATSAK